MAGRILKWIALKRDKKGGLTGDLEMGRGTHTPACFYAFPPIWRDRSKPQTKDWDSIFGEVLSIRFSACGIQSTMSPIVHVESIYLLVCVMEFPA